MKNAITNYENTFYLNGVALSGISSVDGSYSIDYKPINILGKGYIKQIIASVPTANLSINRYLINNDPVFNLTGDGNFNLAQSISGGLYYQNKSFAFSNAYLNSFGITCTVGEVPQISSSFDIYGNIGPISNPSGSGNAGGVFVPQVKNIVVNCKDSSTNRVKDFSLDFNCPKSPIYGLSETSAEIPIEVHNIFPIEVVSSFTLDVDDYETKKLFDDLTSDTSSTFVISVSGALLQDEPLTTWNGIQLTTWNAVPLYSALKSQGGLRIFDFTGSNAKIVSEEINSNADDLLSVKLSYKTYLN